MDIREFLARVNFEDMERALLKLATFRTKTVRPNDRRAKASNQIDGGCAVGIKCVRGSKTGFPQRRWLERSESRISTGCWAGGFKTPESEDAPAPGRSNQNNELDSFAADLHQLFVADAIVGTDGNWEK